ncbi:hypothetical protein BDZ45DRAFT_739189 [Acephala macrosclerotiorum]|nr:hypothetical protein BDZ45DRAFT_739189 [Acephala macrosclerotiorum]
MGQTQSFRITAPQVAEYISEGSYSNLLFHSTSCLVELLVVPIRPSDGTESPSATGSHENRKFPKHATSMTRRNELGQGKSSKDRLSDLPNELLGLVFCDLEFEDALNLALTSQFLWKVGRKHLRNFSLPMLGNWAGKNIVCVGHGVEDGDYPQNLFNEGEAAKFLRWNGNLFNYVRDMDRSCRIERHRMPPLDAVPASSIEEYLRLSKSDRADFRHVLGFSQFYGTNEDAWVLRNLTTKEFVRSEAIALGPEYVHGPHIDHIGFGEVIQSRTGWSTHPETGARYTGLHRGAWAGHAFDITTMKRHLEETEEGDWKDSSQEVSKEIASIWETQFGDEWRQHAIRAKN